MINHITLETKNHEDIYKFLNENQKDAVFNGVLHVEFQNEKLVNVFLDSIKEKSKEYPDTPIKIRFNIDGKDAVLSYKNGELQDYKDAINDINIQGATLLSAEEYSEYMHLISSRNMWLRSHDTVGPCSHFVTASGFVASKSVNEYLNVSPALIIDLKSSILKPGDTFEFGNHEFVILSNKIAQCNGDIGECAFKEYENLDIDTNNYSLSDIKQYIDNWFEKVKETENDKQGYTKYSVELYNRYGRLINIIAEMNTLDEAIAFIENNPNISIDLNVDLNDHYSILKNDYDKDDNEINSTFVYNIEVRDLTFDEDLEEDFEELPWS